jgi:hypothetical protein
VTFDLKKNMESKCIDDNINATNNDKCYVVNEDNNNDEDDNRIYLNLVIQSSKNDDSNERKLSISQLKHVMNEYYEQLKKRSNIQQRIRSSIQNVVLENINKIQQQQQQQQQQRDYGTTTVRNHKNIIKEKGKVQLTKTRTNQSLSRQKIVVMDWTDIAFLHSMIHGDSDDDDDDNDDSRMFQKYKSTIQSFLITSHDHEQQQKQKPPILPLESNWWDRPVWSLSWTIMERMLVHATMATVEFVNTMLSESSIQEIQFVLSNTTKNIEVLLNQIHSKKNNKQNGVIMIYVKPKPRQTVSSQSDHVIEDDDDDDKPISAVSQEICSEADNSLDGNYNDDDADDDGDNDSTTLIISSSAASSSIETEAKSTQQQFNYEQTHPNESILEYSDDSIIKQITPMKSPVHCADEVFNGNHDDGEPPISTSNPTQQHDMMNIITSPPSAFLVEGQVQRKPPQIDSTGLDLTMLSQLPPNLRAEARLVMALAKKEESKGGSKKRQSKQQQQQILTKKNPIFERWLSTNIQERNGQGTEVRSTRMSSPSLKVGRKKQRQSIENYFQKVQPK